MMIRLLTSSLCSFAFISTLSLSPASVQAGLFDDIKKATEQGQKIMKTAEDIANIGKPAPSQQTNNPESAITFFEPEASVQAVNASIEGFTPQATFPNNAQFVVVKLPATYTSRPWPKLHDLLSQPDQKAYVFRADAVANGYENPYDCTHFITSHDKFKKGWILDSSALAAGSGSFHADDRAFPQVLKSVLPTAEPGLCSFSDHHHWKPPGHTVRTPSKAAPMPTISPSFTMDELKKTRLKMIDKRTAPVGTNLGSMTVDPYDGLLTRGFAGRQTRQNVAP